MSTKFLFAYFLVLFFFYGKVIAIRCIYFFPLSFVIAIINNLRTVYFLYEILLSKLYSMFC